MTLLRSVLYQLGMSVLTLVFALLAWMVWPLPPLLRFRIVAYYAKSCMAWLRLTCGLRYRVQMPAGGLPQGPVVVMCKHQSAWETLALQLILPPHSWVLKRELLWLPFFGWGLATLSPIAIDRSRTKKAMQQVIEQGRARVSQGFWIVMFPEGTRIAAGKRGQYKQGGARLALDLNLPILPIAHNAGEFWPRNGFKKYAGEVTVVIGDTIDPAGRTPDELTRQVEDWIEGQMDIISGVGPCHPNRRAASS